MGESQSTNSELDVKTYKNYTLIKYQYEENYKYFQGPSANRAV